MDNRYASAANTGTYASGESKKRIIELVNNPLFPKSVKKAVLGPENDTINRYSESDAQFRIKILENALERLETAKAS